MNSHLLLPAPACYLPLCLLLLTVPSIFCFSPCPLCLPLPSSTLLSGLLYPPLSPLWPPLLLT